MPQHNGQVFRSLTPARRQALEFLKEILADGKKLTVAEIQSRARRAGVTQGSLSYCRKLLKIEITRDPPRGEFFWQLPKGF